MFSEHLIKYILSLKNCNTNCKKGNENYKEKKKHKFRHNFDGSLNPLRSCSLKTESTTHFFLRCRYFNIIRITLMNEINDIDSSVTSRQLNEFMKD